MRHSPNIGKSHANWKKLGRTATSEEIAERMKITARRADELRAISRDPLSLDLSVGKDGENALVDLIEGQSAASFLGPLMNHDVQDEAAHALKTRSSVEEKVIRMRFGIGCDKRVHVAEDRRRIWADARADPPD
jgi:RNA polymerase primary sigma factor